MVATDIELPTDNTRKDVVEKKHVNSPDVAANYTDILKPVAIGTRTLKILVFRLLRKVLHATYMAQLTVNQPTLS
jgi:hypothetical protein